MTVRKDRFTRICAYLLEDSGGDTGDCIRVVRNPKWRFTGTLSSHRQRLRTCCFSLADGYFQSDLART